MWKSIKIAQKIYICMALIIGGYTASMLFVFTTGRDSQQGLTLVSTALFPAAQQSQQALTSFGQEAKAYEDAVVLGDQKLVKLAQDKSTEAAKALGEITAIAMLPEASREKVKQAADTLTEYSAVAQSIYSEMASGNMAQAAKAADLSKQANALRTELTGLTTQFSQDLHNQIADLQAETRHNQVVNGVIFATALIFASLTAVLVVGGIIRRINRTVERVRDISEGDGDLTARLEASENDELGELSRCFNRFVEKLQGIIAEVLRNSLRLAEAAHQLNTTATRIASGSKEAASQSESIASASQEMSTTSRHIAENCVHAANSAKASKESAEEGSNIVQHTVRYMEKVASHVQASANTVESLGARSDQIGDITATIQDIADQINLLALNAAIEAARAGDQGRGFAVVAGEVRALAARTGKATEGIREMIKMIQAETRNAISTMEEGVKEVAQGTLEAEKSGHALQTILDQIKTVAMQVDQIATATEQQTATTNEITNNIHGVAQVVQENAQSANEASEATAKVDVLAKDLQKLVGHFKLGEASA